MSSTSRKSSISKRIKQLRSSKRRDSKDQSALSDSQSTQSAGDTTVSSALSHEDTLATNSSGLQSAATGVPPNSGSSQVTSTPRKATPSGDAGLVPEQPSPLPAANISSSASVASNSFTSTPVSQPTGAPDPDSIGSAPPFAPPSVPMTQAPSDSENADHSLDNMIIHGISPTGEVIGTLKSEMVAALSSPEECTPQKSPAKKTTFQIGDTPKRTFGHSPRPSISRPETPVRRAPLSRTSSRQTLSRSASMAQLARDQKHVDINDTRAFYNPVETFDSAAQRPELTRHRSSQTYFNDGAAMDYLVGTGSSNIKREGSNLLYRTGSRIWDAAKESGAEGWVLDTGVSSRPHSRRTSRRPSAAGFEEDDDGDEGEPVLHPGKVFDSYTTEMYDLEDEGVLIKKTKTSDLSLPDSSKDWDQFADSFLVRATDWVLGIPHDAPYTLRNSLKNKPKKASLWQKREMREQSVAEDPAWLLAAYLTIKELV